MARKPNTKKLKAYKPWASLNDTLFFITTSNFGAEAERSYCFWQFEPEMFLVTCYCISRNLCGRD